MNTSKYLAIFFIATSIAVATTSLATPVLAGKTSGDNGLDKSDLKVHENTPGGFTGDQDIRYHEGLCQGGHEVKIQGGCNNDAISDPGDSDNHRQDK